MFDSKGNHDLNLNESGLEYREYQKKIAQQCILKNSLVVLPTGLGKTIIALYVAIHILQKYPKESKIIVLAPTRPLINQHYEVFQKNLSIPEQQFEVLTGKIQPAKRTDLFHENKILFFTPQTLRNDLVNKKYSLEEVCLIVFDEAHHASGEFPYTLIADTYMEQNPDGTILALTASPGASKEKIKELCNALHIPLENIHTRTRKDEDVKIYLKPMDVYKIGVDMTHLMKESCDITSKLLEERLQYLSEFNFLEKEAEVSLDKIIRKDLLKLNSELLSLLKQEGDKTGIFTALSINAQALILFHMMELVEQQGLDVLLIYLESLSSKSRKSSSSKAIKILAADHRLQRLYLELKKHQELTPENYHIKRD
jgi:ERCC4-related helicase